MTHTNQRLHIEAADCIGMARLYKSMMTAGDTELNRKIASAIVDLECRYNAIIMLLSQPSIVQDEIDLDYNEN